MRDKYKNKKPSSQLDKKKDSIKSEVAKEKVNVPNNWDRYEEDEDLQNVQMEATNFKTLSSNINERIFFQFKHEKKWLEEIKHGSSDTTGEGRFSLNLNLLKAAIGMSPMPFRCKISPDLFTETELKQFDDDTVPYAEQYYKIIQELNKDSNKNTSRTNFANVSNIADSTKNEFTSNSRYNTSVTDAIIKSVRPDVSSKLVSPREPSSQTMKPNSSSEFQSLDKVNAKTRNNVVPNDADSEDELEFLLNLADDLKVSKTPCKLPDVTNNVMKSQGESKKSDIEAKSSDELDMDVLDSLLS